MDEIKFILDDWQSPKEHKFVFSDAVRIFGIDLYSWKYEVLGLGTMTLEGMDVKLLEKPRTIEAEWWRKLLYHLIGRPYALICWHCWYRWRQQD